MNRTHDGQPLAGKIRSAWEGILGKAVKHQAPVMGFSDTFAVIGVVLVLAAVAVVLTCRAKGTATINASLAIIKSALAVLEEA